MWAFTLNTRYELPAIAFGTWDVRGAAGQQALDSALEAGYRAIDTAFMYENHDIVGAALAASGIPRGELFVTTKLNENLAAADLRLTERDRARIAQLDEGASLFGWYGEGWL